MAFYQDIYRYCWKFRINWNSSPGPWRPETLGGPTTGGDSPHEKRRHAHHAAERGEHGNWRPVAGEGGLYTAREEADDERRQGGGRTEERVGDGGRHSRRGGQSAGRRGRSAAADADPFRIFATGDVSKLWHMVRGIAKLGISRREIRLFLENSRGQWGNKGDRGLWVMPTALKGFLWVSGRTFRVQISLLMVNFENWREKYENIRKYVQKWIELNPSVDFWLTGPL